MTAPPAGEGFRWPAEWEPHAATWLAWPHNPTTWPGHLAAAQAEFAAFARELAMREPVNLLVRDAADAEVAQRALADAGAPIAAVTFHEVPTDDAWLRDTGPLIVTTRSGSRRLALDFPFDAWGGKYPPWDRDAGVPRAIAELTGLERRRADFVLEGGSIDGNGAGCVLTTESCLLHANREAGRTREQMERRLQRWLGTQQVCWLADGIAGDDTDGHIDDIARFVGPWTVVAATRDDTADADYAPLQQNLLRLRELRDARGAPLDVVALPMPPPQQVDGQRCPASYANFYIANGCVLVPVFGVAEDARALGVLSELWPERDVVGVPSSVLVQGLGSLHCLSQQEPA